MTRKWILILSCVLVGFGSTVALRISMSNDRRLNAALADLADKADEESAPRNKPRTPARAAVPASKPASLRQRFVELASERAKRMNDEELSQAVAEITQSLADQDAAAETELQTAAEQLKAVAEKFPGTPAGERANRALEAIAVKPIRAIHPPRNLEDGDVESDEDDPFKDRR